MMDTDKESLENLCSKIREETARETGGILRKAKEAVQERAESATKKATAVYNEILDHARQEAGKSRKKIMSGVNLESKKLVLRKKEEVIKDVLEQAGKRVEALRSDKRYSDFLVHLAIEAILTLGENTVTCIVNKSDEAFFSLKKCDEIQKYIADTLGKEVKITVSKTRYHTDGGVIVESREGNIVVDNTISARIRRMMDELRVIISKEVFGG